MKMGEKISAPEMDDLGFFKEAFSQSKLQWNREKQKS